MASSHRIIAADNTRQVASITHAAIDLLEHEAIVIEVQTAEAALAELQRGGVNALVCAFALPDMLGDELAQKAHEMAADLPIIVLASVDDPGAIDMAAVEPPVYFLVRAEKGDQFVRILRAVLLGEELAADDPEAPAAVPDFGPVPEVDVDALGEILGTMLTDVGAMAVVLVDRRGEILQEMGAVGYLDRERLTATLAPNFANMAAVGPLVGGAKPQAMHFYDGDEFDIFALAVGLHHFICLIFEGSAGSRAFGAVTMFGRRAVQEMLEIIGDAAYTSAVAEPVKTAGKRPKAAQPKAEKVQAEAVAEEPKEEYVPPRPPALEPLPEDVDLEAMLSELDKLDLSQADDLFDPEKLAEIAAENLAGERLTLEEAQQLGVMQS